VTRHAVLRPAVALAEPISIAGAFSHMMNAVACSQAAVVVRSHRQHGLSSAPAVCLASRPHIRASRVSSRQRWNPSVTTPLVARPVRHVGAAVVLCRALSSQHVSLPAPPAASMVPYYSAFLVFGCAVNTIGPMLPALAAHVGLTPVDMAPLLSAKGAAGLAGSFLCPLLPLVRSMLHPLACAHLSDTSAHIHFIVPSASRRPP